MTHFTNYQMYVIRLETTLYICGTGHLKIVTLGYNYQQSWRILKKENNRRGEKREENSKVENLRLKPYFIE